MKTQKTLLSLALFIASLSFGQNNTYPFPQTGNVGIGTTTPGNPLQIEKSVSGMLDIIKLRNSYDATSAFHGVSIALDGLYSQSKITSYENPQLTYGGNLQLQTYNGSGVLNTGIILNRLGNVGVGTISPSAKLETFNNIAGTTSFKAVGINGSLKIDNVGSGENYYDANKFHEFQIGGNAKMHITTNGNVGIGTTAPAYPLDVQGRILAQSMYIKTLDITNDGVFNSSLSSAGVATINMGFDGAKGFVTFGAHTGNGFRSDIFYLRGNDGNAGIGTNNPQAKLDVNTSVPVFGRYDSQKWSTNNPNFQLKLQTVFGTSGISQEFVQKYNGTDYTTLAFYQGNVGIGTANPIEKLTVNGTIHATKVKVTTAVPADYVFQKYYTGKSELKSDYIMPTLAEIETFTKKNNHLPNIPSAQEMMTNGVNLGEMNNLLLQKVEELTLYAIEQQKELDRLKTENENYKSLAERLTAIEQQLKK